MATELKKIPHPIPVIGKYSLDLYCRYHNDGHDYGEFPHQFVGRSEGNCRRRARNRGWILHQDHTATCPKCAPYIKYR